MRSQMRESQLKEMQQQRLDERVQKGDALVEKWAERKAGAGIDALYAQNPNKARNLGFILEAQAAHLKSLSENQLSSAFSTAPLNVMKIIRLSYPNSIRGELFTEIGMQTTKDVLYYLTSVYSDSLRGETAGERIVESFGGDYPSEETTIPFASCPKTGSAGSYVVTCALGTTPVREFNVTLLGRNSSGVYVRIAQDLGSGVITNGLSGADAIANATAFSYASPGSVVIAIGDNVAAAYDRFEVRMSLNTEVFATASNSIGKINLQLAETTFRARPFPLGIEWNKMVELVLGTTLNVDVEDQILQGAADEMKKAFDYQALRLAFSYAKSRTGITWDANFANAGSDSEVAHVQSLMKIIYETGDSIYNELGRGGVSGLFGGTKACNTMTLHNDFEAVKNPSKIGAYKFGSINGIDVYKAPKEIFNGAENEMVGIWKNEAAELDTAIIYGTLVPLYSTMKLEHPQFYTEQGLAYYGDYKVTNPRYITNLTFQF